MMHLIHLVFSKVFIYNTNSNNDKSIEMTSKALGLQCNKYHTSLVPACDITILATQSSTTLMISGVAIFFAASGKH